MSRSYLFQYCQKLVVFNPTQDEVLLAKRKGEQDYDGVFSFIGGKMETTDPSILESIRREKNEEIGQSAQLLVSQISIFNVTYKKKDGTFVILPHYICKYVGGTIEINEEYSEYQWVSLEALETFEPKIDTIVPAVRIAKRFVDQLPASDFKKI